MPIVKKLIFALFFLIIFVLLIYQFAPILKSYETVFNLSTDVLINLIIISALIFLSSLIFVVFSALSSDWKFTLPVAVLSSFIPMILVSQPLGIILSAGCLVSFIITLVSLDSILKKYLDFQPAAIFGPPIRNLTGLLILAISLTYFISVNTIIQQKGFQIPDSLIDTALKLTSGQQSEQIGNVVIQILNDQVKQAVKDQLQTLIKPYQDFVAPTLAVLLFFTLQSLTSILNLLIYPLLWIIFYVFEKTGFIKFTTEQRTVKKIVIN